MLKSMLFALVLALPAMAFAATPYVDLEKRLSPEQLHATGLDTLSPDQLAKLNEMLRGDAEQIANAARAEAPKPMEGAPGNGWSMGLDQERIKTRVVGTLTGWEPGTEIELANGQHWKVLKGSLKLPKALVNPEVELVPGIAGRWFFHVDEDFPGARVYRVD